MTGPAVPRTWIDGPASREPVQAVHELFLLRARRHPETLAIRQWHSRLSYRQLASAAARIAARLSSAGLPAGGRVGICMRRTPWLPASALAVLIARGTFVPLDPDQPAARLRAIAGDAGIEIALVDGAGGDLLGGVVGELIAAEAAATGALARDDPGLAGTRGQRTAPGDIAYIMYTSGSAGRPKGVMVSHGNLSSFVSAVSTHLGETSGYRLAAFAAAGFDACVFEFFAPLVCGGSIHLMAEADRMDPGKLQHFLTAHRSSLALLPPVLLPMLDPAGLPALRQLIVGGEACDPLQVGRWAVPDRRRFYNWYGPTEATVAVAGTELNGQWSSALPIGRPLPGSSIYIVDDDMALCRPGQAGELLIGGPQVATGYVSGPPLTAERFVPDPAADAGRLYRTGDLASWDQTGMISFLGRADRQVQIHGRRVEPGEIEVVLSGHPRVAQAVVDVAADSVVRAYVTPADAPSSDELRGYCSAWLPRHMVPASVTALARVPMTVNAKVDFAALRRLAPVLAWGDDPPQPPAVLAWGDDPPQPPAVLAAGFDSAVTRCWAELFGAEGPAPGDDFFLAGGDSLAAMRLAAALRRSTGKDLSADDVLLGRTIAGIAAKVSLAGPVADVVLPTGCAPELSPAQRRLWFVEQFTPGVPVHNILMSERLVGGLDVPRLRRAFEVVVGCQSALRWQLRPGDGPPEVAVLDRLPAGVPLHDLSDLEPEAREPALRALLAGEARSPIGLTGGPLWRIRLVRLGEQDHVLVICVHHIVFDGWSQVILYRELGQAYRAPRARVRPGGQAAGPAAFADYTVWVLDQAERNGRAHAQWWKDHLDGAPAALDLPRDRPRPAVLSFAGSTCAAQADAGLVADVTRLAGDCGTTATAVLLAAFSVLLRRLTGESDQVVGTPVADRGLADFEDVIGFFIRPLPLRLRVTDEAAFTEHVRRCGDEISSALRHADAPLEQIVQAIGAGRDLSRNPLFQVMFNVHNFAEPSLDLGDVAVIPLRSAVPGSLVDLTVYVMFRDGRMRLEVVYNSDLYDGARIDALLGSYQQLLRDLVGNPGRSVAAASARAPGSTLPDWAAPLSREIPEGPGLVEQVTAAAREAKDGVAVEEPGRRLSYADVLGIAGRTAAALAAASVGPGDVVGVLAERTAILPAALLGVLATGARWAVLDADLPDAALRRRLMTVRAAALIRCCGPGKAPLPGLAVPVVDDPVVDDGALAADAPGELAGRVAAAGRGYLSFTSGTTGEPLAVQVTEAPLVHFLNWYRATFGLDKQVRCAMLSGLAHDPLLRDMFTPLTVAGTLVVPAGELLKDPSGLLAWLDDHAITVAHLTPQLVRMMAAVWDGARPLTSLRLVAVGGDQLTEGDAAALRLIAPRARLLNFYGTTETPQVQAYLEIEAGEQAGHSMPVPAGTGIDGVQLLVLDGAGRPAGVGELGEVVIRSLHLANGYVGRPAENERFAPLAGAGTGAVYRTGDLGRYGPSGVVTLAGRVDDQVKIRGFRVGLGEVEAALSGHQAVSQAAVRFSEAGALHGYVVTAGPVTEAELLSYARARLPSYAVPSSVTVLRAMPVTRNGKVDRAALPPPGSHLAAAHEAPKGRLERLVAAIWREVLAVPRVGIDDNFFDIGGHSMSIITVQARLRLALDRHVSVVDLFRFPTIRSLARHLTAGDADSTLLGGEVRGQARRQRASRSRAHMRRRELNT